MKFEMSSIINTYESYQAIQLTDDEIKDIQAGGCAIAKINFLKGATIQVQISGPTRNYPSDWPKPNIILAL